MVQQRKVIDMASLCRDLPDLIPMPLVIGTKVTARLRQPQVGFFFHLQSVTILIFNLKYLYSLLGWFVCWPNRRSRYIKQHLPHYF